jgi:small subunit ribosomal protein S7
VERFANKLMAPGRNAGKKILILNAIKRSFEILEIKTKKSPLQILVDAISNTAPREETTRISYGGIVFHSAVDSSPQRRVDISLKLIALSVQKASFNSIKSLEEIIAEQVLLAASNDPKSNAIKRKQDIERVALSAR